MFSLLKFIRFVCVTGWGILNPNINPMRHAPTHIKYFATILLACFWSLAFGLYTAQFFYIGINMIAHIAVVSMIFVTWYTFKKFNQAYPAAFPQQRDPDFLPKCYELTDAEKLAVINKADRLLINAKS